MAFTGFPNSHFVSYFPRPWVAPTLIHPDALYVIPEKRGVSTKVSIRTGAMLYWLCQSCGSWRRTFERMWEAKFGIWTQGMMR